MDLIGLGIAFILALFLISRDWNMGLSLLLAALITGLFSRLTPLTLLRTIVNGITSFMSIQLMIIVGLISGLGFMMKKTNDLDKMMDSLNNLLNNKKISLMVIPALIGTLNIPGGAILSAPMVEQNGNKINLSNSRKNAINLFFRHIGFFIYPLYPSMILMGELLSINVISIIKYTILVFIGGLVASYFVFFKHLNSTVNSKNVNKILEIKNFIQGFFSILIILILALVFDVPFYYAVLIGTLTSFLKNLPAAEPKLSAILFRIKEFIFKGVDYQLIFTIAGLMAFKEMVETTGLIEQITEIILSLGIPLTLLVIIMGLVVGYISGVHMAATGMLTPILLPLFPAESVAVYGALLFTTINIGYIISPLHLCLVLGNEYFDDTMGPLYRYLAFPLGVMILISMGQVFIFA